ncbi:MAG: sigma-54-dependent Fis family transcriptional regulator [Candidatus Hydrogenedentes bacterium]|nr:sigma-54-dependent Fis family transcriptional regulator [Candidatus Hydrogenedentota bacterium]
MRILVVDDEEIKRTALCDDLQEAGYDVKAVPRAADGLRLLGAEPFDVVVTDLRMPGMDGITFLAQVKEKWPDTEVVMMTAFATVNNAVQAMKLGAFDYITKPFESAELVLVLERIEKIRSLTRENRDLKDELANVTGYREIIGQSAAMRETLEALKLAITSDVSVLLWGETGTGKELFARTIHKYGPRSQGPFLGVSCATLSSQIMESELFGHVKGAFTGAIENKPGRFELAHNGTLFLDEIDDVPLEMQVKLLRVLEGLPFERVGGIESVRTNARFVAATKVDLREKVKAGTFREDLYYRLSVLPVRIPPLRQRREDIPLLINYFLKLYCGSSAPPEVDESAMAVFWDYEWPGNVRELQNVVRRVLLSANDRETVTKRDLPVDFRVAAMQGPRGETSVQPRSFREAVESQERNLLLKALEDSDGNQSKAAATLDMKLSTFRDKLAKYDIHVHSGRRSEPDEADR